MHAPSVAPAFPQNLYFYASENNEEFRRHMLVETLLIPRLVLPYLDRCVLHATILNRYAPRRAPSHAPSHASLSSLSLCPTPLSPPQVCPSPSIVSSLLWPLLFRASYFLFP